MASLTVSFPRPPVDSREVYRCTRELFLTADNRRLIETVYSGARRNQWLGPKSHTTTSHEHFVHASPNFITRLTKCENWPRISTPVAF